MTWHNPLPFDLVPTRDSESFRHFTELQTGLPIGDHPGAFGVVRKNHVHEGVDLYAPEGTVVRAVEAGTVVAVMPFTGEHAGLPWWENTWVVMVEGRSGVVCYGEIVPCSDLRGPYDVLPYLEFKCAYFRTSVKAGDPIGSIKRVLKTDKGRPTSMLHLELHVTGSRSCPEWYQESGKPGVLQDPTPYLLEIAQLELT